MCPINIPNWQFHARFALLLLFFTFESDIDTRATILPHRPWKKSFPTCRFWPKFSANQKMKTKHFSRASYHFGLFFKVTTPSSLARSKTFVLSHKQSSVGLLGCSRIPLKISSVLVYVFIASHEVVGPLEVSSSQSGCVMPMERIDRLTLCIPIPILQKARISTLFVLVPFSKWCIPISLQWVCKGLKKFRHFLEAKGSHKVFIIPSLSLPSNNTTFDIVGMNKNIFPDGS